VREGGLARVIIGLVDVGAGGVVRDQLLKGVLCADIILAEQIKFTEAEISVGCAGDIFIFVGEVDELGFDLVLGEQLES